MFLCTDGYPLITGVGSHPPADGPASGWMRVNRFANNKNTNGPTTPHPTMPIQFATDGENGSQISPTMQMTPVRIISARVAFCSRPPRNTGAASSIESAKNQSQAKVSIVCGNGGHPVAMNCVGPHALRQGRLTGDDEQGEIDAGRDGSREPP